MDDPIKVEGDVAMEVVYSLVRKFAASLLVLLNMRETVLL